MKLIEAGGHGNLCVVEIKWPADVWGRDLFDAEVCFLHDLWTVKDLFSRSIAVWAWRRHGCRCYPCNSRTAQNLLNFPLCWKGYVRLATCVYECDHANNETSSLFLTLDRFWFKTTFALGISRQNNSASFSHRFDECGEVFVCLAVLLPKTNLRSADNESSAWQAELSNPQWTQKRSKALLFQFISSFYHEDGANYAKECTELETLRQVAQYSQVDPVSWFEMAELAVSQKVCNFFSRMLFK